MVKVKRETVRSDTSEKVSKTKIKSERTKEYTRYLRSKQFKLVKEIVFKRQNGLCAICGDPIDNEHPGTCHHQNYRYAGMGGEVEAENCIYIHNDEHRELHRSKLSFQRYSVLNDRNEPVPENHSDLANAIRKERESSKKKK